MSKFNEARLEQAIIELLKGQGYPHVTGDSLGLAPGEVLIKDDLRQFLARQYAADKITPGEIDAVIQRLERLPALDLYDSNRALHTLVADGFLLKRERAAGGAQQSQKDLYVQLLDYTGLPAQRIPEAGEVETIVPDTAVAYPGAAYEADRNIYRLVNQLVIEGSEKRIPDAILYINGLPLVVFEFKSAIREDATLHDAYKQLTVRYAR